MTPTDPCACCRRGIGVWTNTEGTRMCTRCISYLCSPAAFGARCKE